jgi:integrase
VDFAGDITGAVMALALSVKNIAKNIKQPGRYLDNGSGCIRGLYLQVMGPEAASWVLRYQQAGRERWMGLGGVDDLTLEQARKLAKAARSLVKEGIDPIDARKAGRARKIVEAAEAAAKRVTFKKAAEQYYKFHAGDWSNVKHQAQFLTSLETYAYPVIGNLPVGAIGKPEVLRVLQEIWFSKTETASRVRNRIENVLNFAMVNEWRADGPNPAAWTGNLEHSLPAPGKVAPVKHHPALSYTKMFDFMEQLRQRHGGMQTPLQRRERYGVAAAALEFTILTAARTGETVGAQWDEIELNAVPVASWDEEGRESTVKGPVWIIPAERMKKGDKAHKVPLSDRAVEILKSLPREDSPYVFIGGIKGVPISNSAMDQLLKRMKWPSKITVHGFRSAFRDWAGEVEHFPNHVVEMALAHAVGNAVEQAYARGDLYEKRVLLMNSWARWCSTPKHAGGDVVPLRGRKLPPTGV